MKLTVHMIMVGGLRLDDTTSDFATVAAAIETYGKVIGNPNAVMNWHSPDGSVHLIAGRHILDIHIEPG